MTEWRKCRGRERTDVNQREKGEQRHGSNTCATSNQVERFDNRFDEFVETFPQAGNTLQMDRRSANVQQEKDIVSLVCHRSNLLQTHGLLALEGRLVEEGLDGGAHARRCEWSEFCHGLVLFSRYFPASLDIVVFGVGVGLVDEENCKVDSVGFASAMLSNGSKMCNFDRSATILKDTTFRGFSGRADACLSNMGAAPCDSGSVDLWVCGQNNSTP